MYNYVYIFIYICIYILYISTHHDTSVPNTLCKRVAWVKSIASNERLIQLSDFIAYSPRCVFAINASSSVSSGNTVLLQILTFEIF